MRRPGDRLDQELGKHATPDPQEENGKSVGGPPANSAEVADGARADDKKRNSAQFALKHNAK
jgi:hypothetical protein